jgi:hypothetical protein
MAAGDFFVFQQFYVDVQEGLHDLENDTIKFGIITDAVTPAAGDADPRWGAGGSTNFATSQVTAGGNYASGGPVVGNPTVTLASGKGRFDGDDISIAQDGSNPSNGRRAIVYNDTDSGKRAIGCFDLGTVDLTAGPFSFAFNASGLHEMGAA